MRLREGTGTRGTLQPCSRGACFYTFTGSRGRVSVCVLSRLSRARVFATLWTGAHRDPLSVGFHGIPADVWLCVFCLLAQMGFLSCLSLVLFYKTVFIVSIYSVSLFGIGRGPLAQFINFGPWVLSRYILALPCLTQQPMYIYLKIRANVHLNLNELMWNRIKSSVPQLPRGFPGSSAGKMQETLVQFPGQEDLLGKG